MSYETLLTSVADEILTVMLNRPEQLNAFTVAMADELEHVFRWADREDAVRAVIVTGAGRAFCAGMDLSVPRNVFGLDESLRPTLDDMRTRLDDPAVANGVRDTGGRVALAIFDCSKPVIGAVNGVAVGIGATMLLPMDIRLASEAARIGFVFGKLGVTPEACSTWFLPRLVGIPQALEWFYGAKIISPDEAESSGLVKQVLAPDALIPAARTIAREIIDNRSSVSLALIRQMVYRNAALVSPNEAHEIDSLAMFYTSIGDGKEGVQAFREKRPPRFGGRVSKDMPPFYPWWKN